MRSLTILEQGLEVGIAGGLLEIRRGEEVIQRLRVGELDELLLFGNVQLTPGAVHDLLRRKLDVIFLTPRGEYRGRLDHGLARHVELRIAQYQFFRREERVLPLAAALVTGKLLNQRALLLRIQREQKREDLAEAIGTLRLLADQAAGVESLERLRGLEGRAAALYFDALARGIRNPLFSMRGRTRRPPEDPPNAVLSFGYTLLAARVQSAVLRVGLDPYLGVYHAPGYQRPSLVLDLMEEFRPVVVDSLMLRLLNRRELAPEDFEEPLATDAESSPPWDEEAPSAGSRPRAVWLGESGRKIFFRGWNSKLHETYFYPLRQARFELEEILRLQVQQLARWLEAGEGCYQPFLIR